MPPVGVLRIACLINVSRGSVLNNPKITCNILTLVASVFLFANAASAQVSITSPASNATVAGTVSFTCTDSIAGSTTGLYIDNQWVSGSPYSWNTTTAPNGSHYLLCNGYTKSTLNGSANETVTVHNGSGTPQPSSSPSPKPTSSPTPVGSACASTVDVYCTGTTDGPALQSAMNCAGSVVRPHGTCDVNQGLTATNIGYEGIDAMLNVESSVTTGVTLITGPNAYGALPWNHLRMTGSNTNGLLLEGNFTHLDQPAISGFDNNIAIGSNAFLDTIIAPSLWNGGVGIDCPTSPNAGEGIVIMGGAIFNSNIGSYNSGCGMSFIGTHFDGITASPLVLNEGSNGASTDCTNCYIESNVQPSGGGMLSVTGYSASGSMEWIGGQIQQDSSTLSPLISLTNTSGTSSSAPYVRVANTRLENISLSGLSSNPNVALCGDTSLLAGTKGVGMLGGIIGNIPNSGACP
jgi:hypothetical protein